MITTYDLLFRNGVIIERARREHRSLTAVERNIIAAGRNLAADNELTKAKMNRMEMEGERTWEHVLVPVKVVARFAYYLDPYEDIPATASYFILESNHPALPLHGNVGQEDLLNAGIGIPLTPTFKTWVKKGRPVYRGQEGL